MGRLIVDGSATPAVRAVAVDLSPTSDQPLAPLYNLRAWLETHFEFVRDPATTELLHDLPNLMQQIADTGVARGDCDDAAILAGALAASVGYHVALVTVAILDRTERKVYSADVPFSHVWASGSPPSPYEDANGRQVWIEFDVTRPMQVIPVERIARAEAVIVC